MARLIQTEPHLLDSFMFGLDRAAHYGISTVGATAVLVFNKRRTYWHLKRTPSRPETSFDGPSSQ